MAIVHTQLDSGQVIKNVYDGGSSSLRVNVVDASSSGMTVVSSTATPAASINGSAGAIFQVIASTSGNISKLIPNEQTGVPMNIYTGASGFEVFLVLLSPGQDNIVEVAIPAGTRISIRAAQASAPVAGSVYLTFTG